MKILLVDDDKVVLQTIGDFLKRQGHELSTAYDGAEALPLTEESAPDLIISDIQMPGMDGIDFLKAIRERSPEPENREIQAMAALRLMRRLGGPWTLPWIPAGTYT